MTAGVSREIDYVHVPSIDGLNDKVINRKINGAALLRAYNCVLPAISSPAHEGLKVTRRNDWWPAVSRTSVVMMIVTQA
jgi:hypothetical protein